MKRYIYIVLMSCFGFFELYSQQLTSIDLVIEPNKYKAAMTGIGGGATHNSRLEPKNLSAQGAFEMNFYTHKRGHHTVTFPLMIRYNIVNASRIFSLDTFLVNDLALIDHNQSFHLSLRRRSLNELVEKEYLMISPFLDYSFSQYQARDSVGNNGFHSHTATIGGQLGFLMDTEAGPLGLMLSAQGNYLNLQNVDPNAVENALESPTILNKDYVGFGGKFIFQFNDVSIFVEAKRFFPVGNQSDIRGLSDRLIFSIGGNAMGELFKFKRKD